VVQKGMSAFAPSQPIGPRRMAQNHDELEPSQELVLGELVAALRLASAQGDVEWPAVEGLVRKAVVKLLPMVDHEERLAVGLLRKRIADLVKAESELREPTGMLVVAWMAHAVVTDLEPPLAD
jgi:hypothetical protein